MRWLPRIGFGTEGYSEKVARRLRAVNIAAWSIAAAVAFFAVLRFADPRPEMLPRAIINAVAAMVLASIPLLHRYGPLAAPLTLIAFVYAFLIYVVSQVGMDGGAWLAYLSASALGMLLIGIERVWLCAGLSAVAAAIVIGLQITMPDNTGLLSDKSLFLGNFVFNVLVNMALLFAIVFYAFRQIARAEAKAEFEHQRSETILSNILPRSVADRLKENSTAVIADRYEDASVLFADLAGFTALASKTTPGDLVLFLNEVFTWLDGQVERHGLEKIKTSGDAYMVVSGVPEPRDDHAEALADFAIAVQEQLKGLADPAGLAIPVRIGMESGAVVAGVVGTRKFFYDVWGDTVNIASRMELTGQIGKIQIGPGCRELLKHSFELEARGLTEVRGKGPMPTWFLLGRR